MTGPAGTVDGLGAATMGDLGLLAHPSALAEVIERHGVPGTPDPARVLESRVLGGFDSEVIASRGLDLGRVAWRGVPLSWRSPVQDARPLDRPQGSSWIDRFTGGLLTTCGIRHIGAPEGEHGLHGDVAHRPASQVSATSSEGATRIRGRIEAAAVFGPSLAVERTITSSATADGARLTITDDVVNRGPGDADIAMLYHLNLGAPIVAPGTEIHVEAERWRAAEEIAEVPDPTRMPAPVPRIVEAVFEYRGVATDDDGWAHATIRRPGSRLVVEIGWSTETLPHLFQWVFPTAGRWALALEPATTSLLPAERSRAPRLAPGATRRHEIMVTIREAPA